MRLLLDDDDISRGLRRVAGEILERHQGSDKLVLIGIRRGGVPVSQRLARWLERLESTNVPLGSVDITFYRDDAATTLPNPRIGPSQVPVSLDGRRVILIDDVVSTGRTVRAALDALLDYGRPQRIELAALVDRGGRELPIQPDYFLRTVSIQSDERIDVVENGDSLQAIIQANSAPSIFPPES